jgi:hypothetical protein
MIKRIVENVWWKFIIGLLAIFGFFGMKGSDFMPFLSNASWLFDAIVLSLLWGAFIFGIHSYLRSERNRKDVVILNARLDGQFKKIDAQFESVAEGFKDFEKSISDTVDLVAKNQEEFNKRFEWLYQQIEKNQKPNP